MSVLIIHEGTKSTPRIQYDPEVNTLQITGRSITESPEIVYVPLESWIRAHFEKYKQLNIVIFLDYINSGSSKSLRDILRLISSYMPPEFKVKVKWKYEEDDESMHELGEHYRDSAGVKMEMEMVI